MLGTLARPFLPLLHREEAIMLYAIQALLGSLIFLSLYRFCNQVNLYLTRRRLIRHHGCLPPPRYPNNPFLLGLDYFIDTIRAGKSKTYLQRIQRQYNNYTNTFIQQPSPFSPIIINTIEPENIEALLATKFTDYTAGTPRQASFAPLLGRSIFLSDGKEWARSRGLLRPSFARSQIDDVSTFEVHVENLITAIRVEGPKTVDLAELFSRFSADVITDFMFGESIFSLVYPESFEAKFMVAFQEAQNGGEARFRMGRLAGWMPGQGRFWESVKQVHEFMDRHVEKAARCHKDAKQKPPLRDTGFKENHGRYVFLKALAKITDDRDVLRDELLTIFFAGRDSTAATLTNLFFQLARRPDVWQQLRQEVMEKLQGATPSFSQLREMKYLRYCLNESKSSKPPLLAFID
ncbi:MAG: hypothetical protein Q9187_001063 [Circinaria calcarea]